jgi:hypothetical protein
MGRPGRLRRLGVAGYDLDVTVGGGPPVPLARALTGASTSVLVNPGHTYEFFTVARDDVGHVGDAPATPDAVTHTVSKAVADYDGGGRPTWGITTRAAGCSWTSPPAASRSS